MTGFEDGMKPLITTSWIIVCMVALGACDLLQTNNGNLPQPDLVASSNTNDVPPAGLDQNIGALNGSKSSGSHGLGGSNNASGSSANIGSGGSSSGGDNGAANGPCLPECSDGLFCNGAGECDENGECEDPCDDGNPLTMDDCIEPDRCLHFLIPFSDDPGPALIPGPGFDPMCFVTQPVSLASVKRREACSFGSLKVKVRLEHPHARDLVIELVAPNNDSAKLFERSCDSDNFVPENPVRFRV